MKPDEYRSPRDPEARSVALACRPVKHSGVEVEATESGDLLLSYPVAVRPWLRRLARRFGRGDRTPQRRTVQLDALGSQVWEWIDGERSVAEIVTVFGDTHKLPRREAELSVTAFLRMLGKRGLIGMQSAEK